LIYTLQVAAEFLFLNLKQALKPAF